MAFLLRCLSHWFVLFSLLGYQLIFHRFIVPSLLFSVYSLLAFVFLMDILFLLLHKNAKLTRVLESSSFIIDSFFILGLILSLGLGGLYLVLFVSSLQVLALSFYQSRSKLIKYVLWLSILYSFGFLWKDDILPGDRLGFFFLYNLALALSFVVSYFLISFLRDNLLSKKMIPSLKETYLPSSLSVSLHLSRRLKPALRSLLDFFEGSLSQKEDISKQKEDISYQIRQLHKLQDLTEKLDQFTKEEKLRFQILSVDELIQKVNQKLVSHPEKPSFLKNVLELHSKAWLEGSAPHLEKAFEEILINSFQSLRKSDSPEICVKTYNKNDKIFLEFLDNGHGVESEDLPLLFEPLFSKKLGQSGLGLAFVSKIVQAHGGSVKVFHANPKGLRVLIHFPVSRKRDAPSKQLIA